MELSTERWENFKKEGGELTIEVDLKEIISEDVFKWNDVILEVYQRGGEIIYKKIAYRKFSATIKL